eukprot:c27684_g1_i1 orf=1343-2374(+)
MLLTSSIVNAFGLATLVLVILLCLAGVFCVAYVLFFRTKIHQGRLLALQNFNALWVVRIILITFTVLWGVTELLRLPLLRRKGWLFYPLNFRWQANLCKIYTIASFGFIEPCLFLTALFLVQGSMRDAPFTPKKKWNRKVIALILLFCLPIFLVQAVLVIASSSFERDKDIPHYFTRSFMKKLNSDGQDVAVCTFPLFSTLVLALFVCVYNAHLLHLGWKVMSVVINRRLQARVCGLVLALAVLLPLHVSFLGLSVLSTPGNPVFEVITFLGFFTVLLCTLVGNAILVIRPIADALAVRWVFDSLPRRQEFDSDIMLYPNAVPLTVFGVEEYCQLGRKETLLC